jgi:hypothetical protein
LPDGSLASRAQFPFEMLRKSPNHGKNFCGYSLESIGRMEVISASYPAQENVRRLAKTANYS